MGQNKSGGGAPDPPVAIVAHTCSGRTRLSFPDRKEQRSFFEEICEATLRLPGVTQVEGRPATGSLIITHGEMAEALLEAAQRHGTFIVQKPEQDDAPESGSLAWQQWVEAAVKEISGTSGAARYTAIAALLGMAMVQASRGQIMPPATTAVWYALSLVLGSMAPPPDDAGDSGSA